MTKDSACSYCGCHTGHTPSCQSHNEKTEHVYTSGIDDEMDEFFGKKRREGAGPIPRKVYSREEMNETVESSISVLAKAAFYEGAQIGYRSGTGSNFLESAWKKSTAFESLKMREEKIKRLVKAARLACRLMIGRGTGIVKEMIVLREFSDAVREWKGEFEE